MANLTPTPTFDDVYQLETTDPVQGGPGGISNQQAQNLTNRTQWLRNNMPTFQQTPQGGRNTVLTGRSEFGIESVLGAASVNTMRLYAALEPLIFTASQGFDVRGEIVHTVRINSDLDLVMDSGTGTRYGVLLYNTTAGTVQFITVQAVHATGSIPSGSGTMLWYNPITGKTDYNDGSSWQTNVAAVIVGQWDIASGDINTNTIVTYPFRSLFYDDAIAPGTVVSAPTTATPRGGWLLCNGAAVNREYYARLFRAIGTAHGTGNGTTTFNIPDYRAEFLRGNDNGRGVDTSRVLGSAQSSSVDTAGVQLREANVTWATTGAGIGSSVAYFENSNIPSYGTNIAVLGGTETRPRNVSTNFWIKY